MRYEDLKAVLLAMSVFKDIIVCGHVREDKFETEIEFLNIVKMNVVVERVKAVMHNPR